MNDYLLRLIQIYKQKGILIDTNIVLLYIVGSLNVSLIREFSRTSMFTETDFDKLSKFIDFFELKITTPHILTEVSNLIGNRHDIQNLLKTYVKSSEEKFLESFKICENRAFLNFGLADIAISETAKDLYLVLTNDSNLFGFLINQKIDVVSLEQIRQI